MHVHVHVHMYLYSSKKGLANSVVIMYKRVLIHYRLSPFISLPLLLSLTHRCDLSDEGMVVCVRDTVLESVELAGHSLHHNCSKLFPEWRSEVSACIYMYIRIII